MGFLSRLALGLLFVGAPISSFAWDTGYRERNDRLRGSVSVSGITPNYYTGAVKDRFATPVEPWDVMDSGLQGQKYIENKQYWDGTGPIFLYIGAEGPLELEDVAEGTNINDLASRHKALLLGVEHRYYGAETQPTKVFDASSYELLTTYHALDDANKFTIWYKQQKSLGDATKVIVFGYSYGGNLAAWARQTYPHTFAGAVASSGPLTAKADFSEYMEVVGDSLRFWGDDYHYHHPSKGDGELCYNLVQDGMDALHGKIVNGDLAGIGSDFGITTPASQANALRWARAFIIGRIAHQAQYEYTYCVCQSLLDSSYAGADAYHALIELYPKIQKASTASTSLTTNGWNWQYCNEFGYFQTTTSPGQPFRAFTEFTAQYIFTESCSKFGLTYPTYPAVAKTNSVYGGTNIGATNIVFVQGTLDPWSKLGADKSVTVDDDTDDDFYPKSRLHAVLFENCAHCPDNFVEDPYCLGLDEGRHEIEQYLAQWIGQSDVPWDFGAQTVPSASAFPPGRTDCDTVMSAFSLANPSNSTTTASANTQVAAQSKSGKSLTGGTGSCRGLFEVKVTKVSRTVRPGGQVRVSFQVRKSNATVTDPFVVGVQYPTEERLFFMKGSVRPQAGRKQDRLEPADVEIDSVEGIYWNNVPSDQARTFSASFDVSPFFDPDEDVILHPGACLLDDADINKAYCCQYETVEVDVLPKSKIW